MTTRGRFSSLEMPIAPGSGEEAGAPARSAAAGESHCPPRRCFNPEVKDAPFYLAEALQHELAGDFESALRSFSAALGENPLLLAAWVGQVWMLIQLEEYPEARLWADKALEQFPESADLLAAKSLALFRMGHESDARALNDAALQKKGESPWVWLSRGEMLVQDSRVAAEECFQRALATADRADAALLRIVATALRYGKYSLALVILEQAISHHPDAAYAWYLKGVAHERLGLYAAARQAYTEAVEMAPGNPLYQEALHRPAPGLSAKVAAVFRRWVGK